MAGLQLEGVSIPHDRLGGRHFGMATIWRWKQGGLSSPHLGGQPPPACGRKDRVLLGRPDVLVIGGRPGAKV